MAQRSSGYNRVDDDQYETPAEPVIALIPQLEGISCAWDPCNRGSGKLIAVLRAHGVNAVGTGEDFLTVTKPPADVDAIVTNPPYGVQGRLAEAFIAHALELMPFTALLLRNDFDSAKSRQRLFRYNPHFACKLVLLDRIRFFEGPSSPSDNHAWFLFDRGHRGPAVIQYVSNTDSQLDLPASSRWLPARGAASSRARSTMHSFELAGQIQHGIERISARAELSPGFGVHRH
jgi:hypothetical protein